MFSLAPFQFGGMLVITCVFSLLRGQPYLKESIACLSGQFLNSLYKYSKSHLSLTNIHSFLAFISPDIFTLFTHFYPKVASSYLYFCHMICPQEVFYIYLFLYLVMMFAVHDFFSGMLCHLLSGVLFHQIFCIAYIYAILNIFYLQRNPHVNPADYI